MKYQKNILNKYHINYKKYLAHSYSVISLILFLWLAFFTYNNLYTTINDIKVLYILREQVSQKKLDMSAWQKINKDIIQKKRIIAADEPLNNPFK